MNFLTYDKDVKRRNKQKVEFMLLEPVIIFIPSQSVSCLSLIHINSRYDSGPYWSTPLLQYPDDNKA